MQYRCHTAHQPPGGFGLPKPARPRAADAEEAWAQDPKVTHIIPIKCWENRAPLKGVM